MHWRASMHINLQTRSSVGEAVVSSAVSAVYHNADDVILGKRSKTLFIWFTSCSLVLEVHSV